MDLRKLTFALSYLLVSGCIISSCSKEDEVTNGSNETQVTEEIRHANNFAKESLGTYYYWNKEISEDLKKLNPDKNTNPIATVEEIRYHEGEKEIDKWTMLTDNMEEFTSSVQGVSTTYGYTPMVYRFSNDNNKLFAAIAFVYEDSPAEKAGLKRGDIITEIDNKPLTLENYMNLFYSSQITLSLGEIDGNAITTTDKKISMTAVEMYENPILCNKIFDLEGKRVGYLAYSSFDLKSIPALIEICKEFKNKGVQELILDLRYNGGGYVITECVLASMLAPQRTVISKEIFEKEEYNDFFTEYYKNQGISTVTRFETEYKYDEIDLNVSTKDANIEINKIYGLISGNSASASEALLSGLMPYMEIELIGQQSHGKYCTGWMLSAEDAYENVPQAIKNWGIYVMVSIYKNANDETPCMPDGLKPDMEVEDNPLEPYQLGDENEAMLRAALEKAGKEYPSSRAGRIQTPKMNTVDTPKKAVFGRRIIVPLQSYMPDNG